MSQTTYERDINVERVHISQVLKTHNFEIYRFQQKVQNFMFLPKDFLKLTLYQVF